MKIFITVVISVVVTLVVAVGGGLWFSARAKGTKGPATKVRIENPQKGELVEVITAPGQVQAKTKVSISARIPARIKELPYKEGDRVTKGDASATEPIPASVLVRLDATDLEAALQSTEARRAARAAEVKVAQAAIASQEASVEGTQTSLDEAGRDLARHEKLHKSGDVSQSDYDRVKCRFDELTAQLKSAAHALESRELNLEVIRHQLVASDAEIARAKDQLSYTTITSPIDGVVTRLNAEVGELVVTGTMNNPGTVIVEVADLSKMLVVAEVDESDIGALKAGQRAVIRVRAHPDRQFTGAVESIALTGQGRRGFESRSFLVEVLLDAHEKQLYSGLTAEVEIETRRHANILKIPSQSVLGKRVDELPAKIRDGNPNVDTKKAFTTVVYRYKDGKAVVTPIIVGSSDATDTIIRSGLGEHDRVITGPYKVLEKLKHDQRVEDERESAATQPAETQPADEAQSKPPAAGTEPT